MDILLRGPLVFGEDDPFITVTDRVGQRVLLTSTDFFNGLAGANIFQRKLGAARSAQLIPACAACQKRPKH